MLQFAVGVADGSGQLVMLPKGFTVAYGLLHPGASMGEAANVMLPRHVPIVMWLVFAFPVRHPSPGRGPLTRSLPVGMR